MNCKLERLVRRRREATEALCAGVAELFPVGCVVEATIGRATFRAEVVSHAEGWCNYYAGSMRVRNLTTGSVRRVYPACESYNVRLIMPPNAPRQDRREAAYPARDCSEGT